MTSSNPSPEGPAPVSAVPDQAERHNRPRLLVIETLLVLGVSLGASAVWSALSLLRSWSQALANGQSLSQQSSSLNGSASVLGWLDLVYQLVGIALALVPVALAIHLLAVDEPVGRSRAAIVAVLRRMGIDRTQPGRDLLRGALLSAAIGLPGLALYFGARAAGLNTTVSASSLGDHWWTVPVLMLAAAQNAILEEVIMIGYLFRRWASAGWSTARIIWASALIRGAYHLYQGLGGFVGNVIMGAIFGYLYTRTRRVMPLIIAHTILDVVSFVGYALLSERVSWL